MSIYTAFLSLGFSLPPGPRASPPDPRPPPAPPAGWVGVAVFSLSSSENGTKGLTHTRISVYLRADRFSWLLSCLRVGLRNQLNVVLR